MNINWALRFKNKVTLTAVVVQVIAIVYAILGMAGIVPKIGENVILLGIVVDPTTAGANDSTQALGYTEPKK